VQPILECMERKPEDVLAAAVLCLWAVAVAPGWSPAFRLLSSNDMLAPISGLMGLVAVGTLFAVTAASLGLAVALVIGQPVARLQALLFGVMSTLGGLMALASGAATAFAGSRLALGTLLLALVGGVLITVLMLRAGIALPRPKPRRGFPQPWSRPPTPEAPSGAGGTGPFGDDYWVRSHGPGSRRPPPAAAPFWEDLGGSGWVLFLVLAAGVLLGGYWFGGRWHRGPHPVPGFLLLVSSMAGALWMDWRRRVR
jgi:hypothetical protein